MTKKLENQQDFFGRLLLKYFYTKDEIDRKLEHFATKEDLKKELERFATKEDLKKAVDEGIDRVKVLFEDNKSKIEFIAEGHSLLAEKINSLDCRVTKLEKTV